MEEALQDNVFLLVLNGPPRSGKDTAGEMLIEILKELPGVDPQMIKVAAPLKAMAKAFCGFDDQLMKKADGPLKDCVIDVDTYGEDSFRDINISISEDWAKKRYGSDVFGKLFAKEIRRRAAETPWNEALVLVCTDGGFQEELLAVEELIDVSNRMLIQVERKGTSFDNDSRSYVQFSDSNYARLTNDGSLTDLHSNVSCLLTVGKLARFINNFQNSQ